MTMKSIGSAAEIVVRTAENRQSVSTEVALVPRETPLTVQDFAKIEELIEHHGGLQMKTIECQKAKVGADGKLYGWEFDLKPAGCVLNFGGGNVPSRLIEAIQRPCSSKAGIYHFGRLAGHKRNTRGERGFQVILEDLCYDLRGSSEWAIMKACEYFRNDKNPFFPDYDKIIETVMMFDKAARDLNHVRDVTKMVEDQGEIS